MKKVSKTCPTCNSAEILEGYYNFDHDSNNFCLNQCQSCNLLFYSNEFFIDFEKKYNNTESLENYIEKTCDFEEQITVVNNFLDQRLPNFNRGLDIGCGTGVAMDFAQRTLGKKMIGFEPADSFCSQGTELLQLNIVNDFFSPGYLKKEKYHFAICLQVIQQVEDVELFMQNLTSVLDENGSLLLSTSNNEFVNTQTNFQSQFAVLSPGIHRQIFDEKSLRTFLKKWGFAHVTIFKKNMQMYAIASKQKAGDIDLFKFDRQVVIKYYARVLASISIESALFRGFWQRYYRCLIDNSNYEEALALIVNADWFEVWSVTEIERLTSSHELSELNTYADVVIYYYTGILFLNHLGKHDYAEAFFKRSFFLAKKMIHLQPAMSLVEIDIIWLARLHELISQLYKGDIINARRGFEEFINLTTYDKQLPKPSEELIFRATSFLKSIK